jgi:hypothetical protein
MGAHTFDLTLAGTTAVKHPLFRATYIHGPTLSDLDALSDDGRADGILEFMFSASPLSVTGASGGPVSALAMK